MPRAGAYLVSDLPEGLAATHVLNLLSTSKCSKLPGFLVDDDPEVASTKARLVTNYDWQPKVEYYFDSSDE